MRLIAFVLTWAALSTVVLAGDAKAPPHKPPPPPGVHWERDVPAGLARAMREGRPVLFAINALENEAANNRLAQSAYRSAAWGAATRGYVAFVCNGGTHAAPGETACARYPGLVCAAHQAALTWFMQRFGEALISPQHVILEPDGDVAFRKEYFTGVVGPALLDAYLSRVSPHVAYARAGIEREAEAKRFAALPLDTFDAQATDYLAGRDGLAAATLLNVLDDSTDPARRAAVIRALRGTHDLQVPVLALAAEERVLYPADDPQETSLWIAILLEADHGMGVWAATRALVRLEDEAARDAVLRIWADDKEAGAKPSIDDLLVADRPAAYEALLLAGDRRALANDVPASWTAGRELEIARARRLAGRPALPAPDLAETLTGDASAGRKRTALEAASPAALRLASGAVVATLTKPPQARLRIAAALACLRARLPQGGRAVRTILDALDDLVEGPPTRREMLRILEADPGRDREVIGGALRAFLGENDQGGAK